MRGTVTWIAALLMPPLLAASIQAAVKTSEITLKSGNETIKAFLAEPDGKGPFPGVVVIQEWWGLTDWIKDNAKRLAEQGYVALAPDLYRGKVAESPMVARQLMSGMPQDRALRDLKAAAADLAGRANVRKDRIASIGWCMGGGLSLQLALHDPQIHACVMCYGRVVTDPNALQPLKASVLGIFGEQDMGIPIAGVHKFEEALKKDGKSVQIFTYKAGHGFMRPQNNPAYQAEAAKDAWNQIDKFLAQNLGAK
jgi:carboxymethylenebutenolidase